jgi:hypothetical protein
MGKTRHERFLDHYALIQCRNFLVAESIDYINHLISKIFGHEIPEIGDDKVLVILLR